MGFPFLSLPDPKNEAEGTIDPLGLASTAEHMAEAMLPGMTQRMRHPRFLSLMCLSSRIASEISVRSRDGATADLAFEWIIVGCLAHVDDDVGRVPGIGKARAALFKHQVPISSRTYLKSPRIFGFHGVYKTLAVALGLVDDELRLLLNGERLLDALGKGAAIEGLLYGGEGTPGGKLRSRLRDAVVAALEQGGALPGKRSPFFEPVVGALRPTRPSREEATFIRKLIDDNVRGGTRGEVFGLLADPVRRERASVLAERPLLRELATRASPELASTLNAIEGFEALAKPLMDGVRWVQFLSSEDRRNPVTSDSFARRVPDLVSQIRAALDRLPAAVASYRNAAEVDGVVASVADVGSMENLFSALLTRHEESQRRKPPHGKRPWFERTQDGGALVRPLFRLDEPPTPGDFGVHFYRTAAVTSFLDDLGAFA